MAVRSVPRIQRKIAVFVIFSFLAVTLGCRGFFQNPVLQSVTVGPANLTLQQGTTQQMTATGNFDDGSTKTLTSGVVWSSTDTTVAPVSASGVVSGAASGGPVTITAEDGTVSGTATVNIALANVTSIKISPTTETATANGGTAQFTALATVSGQSQPIDVSKTVTWSTSDSNLQITQGQSPATVTAAGAEVVTITATYNSTTTLTATATLTVQ